MKEIKEQIQQILHTAIEQQDIAGGSVMFRKEGKEIFYCEDGFADRERQKPIKRDTIFRLYSMSKPVTSVAVMILLERGKLDLYEPVSRYLPGFSDQKVEEGKKLVSVHRPVHIKDLLNMTSGIVYGGEQSRSALETEKLFEEIKRNMYRQNAMTTIEAMNRLGACPLAYQPGESWKYGASADVLGAVVEIVSGMRFGEFLEKEIFKPLGMEDTGFYVPSEKRARLAKVYETDESGTMIPFTEDHLAISNQMEQAPAFESGGAGLVSTITDCAKFTQMLLNGGELGKARILRQKTVQFMSNRHLKERQQREFEHWFGLDGHSYSNLMRVVTDLQGTGTISRQGEYGWDGWLGCYFTNCPNEQSTLLFMTQKANYGTSHLTRKLRNIVFSF